MRAFLLLLVVPCLIAADIPCPDSNIECPSDKKCCEINGQQTCCEFNNVDDVHILEGKMKVYAGEPVLEQAGQYPNITLTIQQGLVGQCNIFNCKTGMCCRSVFCCKPGYSWSCCPDNKCCPPQTKCCPVGCCLKKQDCCAGGCCAENQKCCGGWCCKKKQQCGINFNTCYGKGASFTPAITTILLLAATVMMSRHL